MKKPAILFLILTSLLGFTTTFSHAGIPPHPYHLTTVRWVVATKDNLDVDDRYVTLIGKVTQRDDGSDYWFTDGTAYVRLDTNDLPLPIGQKIMIGGRIDQAYLGIGHLEVNVQQWRPVK